MLFVNWLCIFVLSINICLSLHSRPLTRTHNHMIIACVLSSCDNEPLCSGFGLKTYLHSVHIETLYQHANLVSKQLRTINHHPMGPRSHTVGRIRFVSQSVCKLSASCNGPLLAQVISHEQVHHHLLQFFEKSSYPLYMFPSRVLWLCFVEPKENLWLRQVDVLISRLWFSFPVIPPLRIHKSLSRVIWYFLIYLFLLKLNLDWFSKCF